MKSHARLLIITVATPHRHGRAPNRFAPFYDPKIDLPES